MKVGDCVNLKTGGYLMTVSAINGECVECRWFDDVQQLREGTFELSKLRVWVERASQ